MRSKYQTLNQFVLSPFYDNSSMEKDLKYATRYQQYVSNKSIYVKAACEIEGSWYYHIKVPSEASTGKMEYDVVIRFFTDKEFIKMEPHLRNYYIQFFSNSPGFIYKYAYVYNQRGYLISHLADKVSPEALTTPPDKTNINQALSYDSTIYFACRFLSKFRLTKIAEFGVRKVNSNKFFSEISDFNSIRIENDIINEEKKLQKELKNSNKTDNTSNKNNKRGDISKFKPKNKGITKITPKSKKPKIVAKNSTSKRK